MLETHDDDSLAITLTARDRDVIIQSLTMNYEAIERANRRSKNLHITPQLKQQLVDSLSAELDDISRVHDMIQYKGLFNRKCRKCYTSKVTASDMLCDSCRAERNQKEG